VAFGLDWPNPDRRPAPPRIWRRWGTGHAGTAEVPLGLAVDGSSNVYVADALNNRIRRIDTNGVITTIAGTGTFSSGPDGVAPALTPIGAPQHLSLDGRGSMFFRDSAGSRARRFGLPP
jgi:trimeric autotransporter adhesin